MSRQDASENPLGTRQTSEQTTSLDIVDSMDWEASLQHSLMANGERPDIQDEDIAEAILLMKEFEQGEDDIDEDLDNTDWHEYGSDAMRFDPDLAEDMFAEEPSEFLDEGESQEMSAVGTGHQRSGFQTLGGSGRIPIFDEEGIELPDDNDGEFARYMKDAREAVLEIQRQKPLMREVLPSLPANNMTDFEADMAEFRENLREASGIGRRRGGRHDRSQEYMTLEVRNLLQVANELYVQKREEEAIPYLYEVIRLSPRVEHAWLLLALIKESQGNHERAFIFRYCAAQNTRNPDLWVMLARELRSRGSLSHAIYCYTKALVLQPKDITLMHERCELYLEANQYRRAIEGYEAILRVDPENQLAINQVLRLYVERGRSQDAILLYERLMEDTLPLEGPVDPPLFRWPQLNFLAELYMEVGEYERALLTIKRGARRLQLRGLQIVWETRKDDSEYDEHPLPVDLRTKLGICRLMMGDITLAKHHISQVLTFPVATHQELFHHIAEAYIEVDMIQDAIHVYEQIRDAIEDDMHCRVELARCHKRLGNLETAIELLRYVDERVPNNETIKEELANLYETIGDQGLALRYLGEMNELCTAKEPTRQRTSTLNKQLILSDDIDDDSLEDSDYHYSASEEEFGQQEDNNVRKYKTRTKTSKRKRPARRLSLDGLDIFEVQDREAAMKRQQQHQMRVARVQYEEHRTQITINHYRMLQLLEQKPTLTALEQAKYNEVCDALFREFSSTPWLYPRNDTIIPIESDDDAKVGVRRRVTALTDGYVRGKSYEEWLVFLVKYVLRLCQHRQYHQVRQVLRRVQLSTIYAQEERWRVALKLAEIATNLREYELDEAYNNVRYICRMYDTSDETLMLYNAIAPRGLEGTLAFASNNAQKHIRRLVSVMENEATQAPERARDILRSELFMLHGNMFFAARTYTFAIAYFTRAYQLDSDNPLVCMLLGLAHIHRAMQRKTENRHGHIIRGFTFLTKYAKLRGDNQETAYNLGRAFHHLGLTYLAVPQYERVFTLPSTQQQRKLRLEGREKQHHVNVYPRSTEDTDDWCEDDPTDLRREAAYNLSLIYIASGSPGLAQALLARYCTF